ncbi:hypothetical protein PIB30_092781 [Stylosanthes scabra]|uniref:F-box domain-containing protein n=1 Tax=Stylosanthes scabra TaxID=79078 RepID=A0ABU6TUB3_9FABA|nr:hypothetical protein [Stylosanthes scabra]
MDFPKPFRRVSTKSLPNDLIIEVFLRTDLPTVARCRCISRYWRDILQSDAFLSQYSQVCYAMQPSLLLHVWFSQWNGNSESLFRICSSSGKRLYFPPLPNIRSCVDVSIVGNQHGNLCISYINEAGKLELLVWNVLTGAKRLIPGPPNDGFPVFLPTLSFAHIPGFVHYSIVHTFRKRLDDQFFMYQVYSSQNHTWSPTRGSLGQVYRLGSASVTLNGVIYWINFSGQSDDTPESIISFCVANREFNILNLPPNYHSICRSLILYEDRIALLYLPANTNNYTASIVSLRKKFDDKLSWRVELKLKCVRSHDVPKCFVDRDLISVTEEGQE